MVRRLALVLLLASGPAFARGDGAAAWDKIYEVLSHPRCSNCHVGDNGVPRWSGDPHGMYINAGQSYDAKHGTRVGADFIPCSACHSVSNSQLPHGPPGARHDGPDDPEWSLPPPSMQWSGKSSADICKQVKDPSLNGGRKSVTELTNHFKSGLVNWGWDPGPGRETAPDSKDKLIAFFAEWDSAGRHCPGE